MRPKTNKVNPLSLKRLEVFYSDITACDETTEPEKQELQTVSTLGYLVSEDRDIIKICQEYIKDEQGTKEITYKSLVLIPKSVIVNKEEF